MQQQNGTTIPNFQQTLNNNISYSQLQQQQQHQYFNNNINNNSLNNSETFYQLQQQQLYQSQQIPTSELKEIQQQQQHLNNIEQQFVTNNENIKKRGPGPGRPPKNKIDNAKRDDSAGCSNVYEYNNMKPDEMQMLSLETKSATLMDGRTTIQPNLSTVQFPYGDASSNACFANQINFDVSSLPTCPQDYNNIGVTWTGHQSAGYGITSNQLGFTEIDLGLYANTNGLMALPGQLQYELDPMLATAYGVWPAVNGYYMGTETGKLLTTDGSSIHVSQQPSSQQYMATASTSNNYTGDNAQSTTTTTFYGAPPPPSLQNILPSSIDQTNVFHTGISTLPPPPSQLATADQLYGLQNGHQNGVFGQLTSIDSSLPTCNILPISNNTKPETPNTPITLLNLEQQQCSSSNVNQFIIQQQEQQNQLLFVGNTNEQNIQKIETNLNSSTILPLKEIPTTLSLISAPQIETISSTTTTFGRKYKSKKNNSKNMFSRQSTSRGLFYSKNIGNESPSSIIEKSKNYQKDISSTNGRKSRSHSLLKDSDDDRSAEEREIERRNANNTRERIRVRDINAAFKELARLCCNHMPNLEERNLTKLNTLMKAVELIPMLEKKVGERTLMMNPRADSIRHRNESMPSSFLVTPAVSTIGILDSNIFGSSSEMSSSLSSSLNCQQQNFE